MARLNPDNRLAAGGRPAAPDPRQAVEQLTDTIPVLLFPVRLETRFFDTELRLRIYPDDLLLDTFDPVLTETEVGNAQRFWTMLWRSGDDETAQRAAWRTLVEAHGSGRAGWIVDSYQPTNPEAKPATAGDPTMPAFPSVATRATAWSQPARITMLPQRFVFIGYPGGGGDPVVVVGNPVPPELTAGPDPSATGADQLHHDGGDLVIPPALRWVADFDAAVSVGMAMRIPLTKIQARGGFDRVLVLGVRLAGDPQAEQVALESLLTNHSRGRKGLALVPVGTPTNNTEEVGSGHGRGDDPDASFDRTTPQYLPTADWDAKRDGQWLAEQLGVAQTFFAHTAGAGGGDQATARAMNRALFPATLGYWMETLLAPVFDAETIAYTRDFMHRYVVAAGSVPTLRIGNQPYGILPTTAFSRMRWLDEPVADRHALLGMSGARSAYLRGLYHLLRAVYADWAALVAAVSRVGGSGDPHQALLDIVGLHPGSVEWTQRRAESLATLFNRLSLQGLGGVVEELVVGVERVMARDLLNRLGAGPFTDAKGEQHPPLLDKVYAGKHNLLTGPVIDDRPLSESAPVREYTADHRNYLRWLADAARISHDALYRQDGFLDDRPPKALLYLLLRHALQLSYHDVSVRLHVARGLYSAEQAVRAKADDPFIHIRGDTLVSESRYQPLYVVSQPITGTMTVSVGEYIGSNVATLVEGVELRDQLAAVDALVDRPTAQLERAFADHVDTVGYRLDAWLLGLVHHQLALMRGLHTPAPTSGVHLGAYAWLEDLRPEHAIRTPKRLTDPELVKQFNRRGEQPLMTDSGNQGYVHAPSANHAVAAAVLRNGYLSNADSAQRDLLAVNLTSGRVRTALAALEGIRAGQSLSDLLGYQLERGLHDRHGPIEVDKFIYKLRKAFPLRADRMSSTRTPEGVPIEAIEARNVVDGLALVEHLKSTGTTAYPFGKEAVLPPATPAEAAAITAEAARLLDTHDAVADLALAEGVYQAVIGNYDRVASTYDAYAHGRFPPEPDIIRTPLSGVGLTNRVALHLRPDAPTTSPVAGLAMTPRALAEPAVNDWLARVLPPLASVGCVVSYRDAATGAPATTTVTLRDLELQPVDLLAVVRDDHEQAMSELDDRVTGHVRGHASPRPDAPMAIGYFDAGRVPVSVFEILPLLRAVRRLLTASRPLTGSDLSLTEHAQASQDDAPHLDAAQLTPVVTGLTQLRDDLAAFVASLDGVLADPVANREALLSGVDAHAGAVTGLLRRAATFALPQTGWGFAHDGIRAGYAAIIDTCADRVDRWDARIAEFADRVARSNALPPSAGDAERFRLLGQAERAIASVAMDPRPATPAGYLAALQATTLIAFQNRRQGFIDLVASTRTTVSGLRTDVLAQLPITAVDVTEFALTGAEDGLITLLAEIRSVAATVRAAAARRLDTAQDLISKAATAGTAREQVTALVSAAKALLSDEFRVVPRFTVDPAHAAGLTEAYNASRTGEIFSYLKTTVDFPVDTWLHGVARVRDPMAAWEQTQLLAEVFTGTEPVLDALQVPHVTGEQWLGLQFPAEPAVTEDRLLYTAHFAAPFDPSQPLCGLLLDEWSEVIPGSDADTGLTFHFDRPNTEAPQTMLLVTPSQFRGGWQWADLVDALNETLDLAKLRALEPHHVDTLPYAWFLPATMLASQARQLTIAADLSQNNHLRLRET